MKKNKVEKSVSVYMPLGMPSLPTPVLFPKFQFTKVPGKVNNQVIFYTCMPVHYKYYLTSLMFVNSLEKIW